MFNLHYELTGTAHDHDRTERKSLSFSHQFESCLHFAIFAVVNETALRAILFTMNFKKKSFDIYIHKMYIFFAYILKTRCRLSHAYFHFQSFVYEIIKEVHKQNILLKL